MHLQALRVLRCTSQFVILLAAPPPAFGQLLCPCASLHSIAPSLRFISPRSPLCIASGHGILCYHTKAMQQYAHTFFATSAAAHWVPLHSLRRSFISVRLSPPAACLLLCSPRRPTRLHPASICTAHSSLISPASAKPSLHSSATSVPGGNILRWLPMELPIAPP